MISGLPDSPPWIRRGGDEVDGVVRSGDSTTRRGGDEVDGVVRSGDSITQIGLPYQS